MAFLRIGTVIGIVTGFHMIYLILVNILIPSLSYYANVKYCSFEIHYNTKIVMIYYFL
ncbi:hypothetical protein GLOIN_2v1661803 [Rhizophagus irregularis DAOM 181602=DAOM 197198]|uniref:Uncharacterized protein n=1 Tax=Rhizophagus irregularis (strain DAOM 181602 / DAOM 197198 / MUCL 43194) TaxID=747089 RepID=A0A2P4PKU7_RHIID|nr:hypothetical protein GLOIN_2v1661803 [Rhizophagus irregularis DAOM 181602=DAOM 197198]POG65977.1 hypothetical protein GLOIN_2v1661803 [Rhizophagus irregularis DAOM 181602=DAOM 197198]|eukprot:XP_025172843.1 hypothetical protein GLOIN_2v1661803 [Rhizophagus irregularis DAOM 181602=DAOM 197198]